jgi:hypothetical protein
LLGSAPVVFPTNEGTTSSDCDAERVRESTNLFPGLEICALVWRQNPLAGSHVFDWPFLVI